VAPGTGLLRLTRAAFFAGSAVGLASAAHLAAGDDLPVPVVLLAVPAVMIVVNLLAAGRRGPVGLFLGMGLTQVGLHPAFMLTSLASTCAPSSAMTGTAGHRHVAVTCEAMSGHGVTTGSLWPSVPMALAHAVATLLLVLLLARGEAAVWALAACLHFRFPQLFPVVQVLVGRPLPVAVAAVRRIPEPVHLRTFRRRGPPVPALAVG
jgi:hypothetical protein